MAIIPTTEENLRPTEPTKTEVTSSSNAPQTKSEPMPQTSIATPTIVNKTVPLVMFIGPASSGKSMILVRLAKFLRNQGYSIKTDPTFLNTEQYQQDCKEFENSLHTTTALKGTLKFLLVNIYDKNGEEVAKLLEAPGEDFYATDREKIRFGKNESVEAYLATIMTSPNPKSYVVLLDLDSDTSFRRDGHHREAYETRFLQYFYPAINKKRDKIILLYNKIDMTQFGDINGCNNPTGALKDAKRFYPALFSTMRVTKLGGFITVDNFVFKTFCTGMFATQTDSFGTIIKTYNIASDTYPRELWKEITSKW